MWRRWWCRAHVIARTTRFIWHRLRIVSAATIILFAMQVTIPWATDAGATAAIGIYDWRSLLLDDHIKHSVAVATIVIEMSTMMIVTAVIQQTNVFPASRVEIGAMTQIGIPVREVRSFPEYLRRLRTMMLVWVMRIFIGNDAIASAIFVLHVMRLRRRFGEICRRWWFLQRVCATTFTIALLPIAIQYTTSIQTALPRHQFTRFERLRFVGCVRVSTAICHGCRQWGKWILQRVRLTLFLFCVAHPCEIVVAARRFIWDAIKWFSKW